jgi:hypothetical protein
VPKNSGSMFFMCGGGGCLFCELIHGGIAITVRSGPGRWLELRFDVAQFDMLTTHMNTAINMARGGLVASLRVKRHGDGDISRALVVRVAQEDSRIR